MTADRLKQQLELPEVAQIGVVVEDLDRAASFLERNFGLGPFRVEEVEIWWSGFGVRVLMPSYRRPLGYIFDALHEAGFLVERVIEARPTQDYREADPEGYEVVSKRPSFLCVKAIVPAKN